MATATNSLNINDNGVVSYNNTTGVFSESALTQHDVLVGGSGNAITSVSPSTATFVLTSNGTGSDPSFQTVSASGAITQIDGDSGHMNPTAGVVTINGGSTGLTTTAATSTMNITGTLNAGHGGTGLATLTTYELIASGTTATGNFQQIASGSSGQVLYSNGIGSLPSFGAAPTGVAWVDVTSGTQTIAASTGYVTDNATQVTYTLPATGVLGQVFEITGGINGSVTAPWLIAQNANQQINFGNSSTTGGIGGSLASTLQFDSVRCLCVSPTTTGAATIWNVLSSVGNLIVT